MTDRADAGPTLLRKQEQYRDRWSSHERNSGILSLSEMLSPAELRAFEIFADFDDKLLEKLSPDISLATWKKGVLLFEEGSYIDLAFFIADGEIEIFLNKHQEEVSQAIPIFDEDRTVVRTQVAQPLHPTDTGGEQSVLQSQLSKQAPEAAEITFLSTLDFDLPKGTRSVLGKGELFGEIGALSGWPQSVTAKTTSECKVVQIRVPALRIMKRRSRALKERIDALYRQRSLGAQIKATPLFRTLDTQSIQDLVKSAELVSCEPDEMIVQEGEPASNLYLVRSGFVKLMQTVGEAPMAVTYISKGMTFGETECLLSDVDQWTVSASSVKYSELVRFKQQDIQDLLGNHPDLENLLWTSSTSRLQEIGRARRDLSSSEFLDSALEAGLVQGNSILVIDLDRCTRCDDCVQACKDTHGGQPRFVREGDKYQNLLITKACYHCRDPVCLVGCPTGAIRRANVGAVVEIDDSICIGCSACANNCPYDAIIMQDTGEVWPENAVPEGLRGKSRKLASKCDLCHTSKDGPACVKNCPNECAYRVGSLEEIRALLSKE